MLHVPTRAVPGRSRPMPRPRVSWAATAVSARLRHDRRHGLGSPPPAPSVSLVIPAHNERERLPETLRDYAAALASARPDDWEIVVVANGSTDDTAEVARRLAPGLPGVRVLDIPEPIRKGGAVVEGFRVATGRDILFADADGATAPASLLALLDGLADTDVVIGTRHAPGSVILQKQPLRRRILSRIFNLAVRRLFGLPFRDTQCGAKAFRGPAARRLAEVVRERDWTFDLDLLLWARRFGMSVDECAVTWSDVGGSRLAARSAASGIAWSLVRVWAREQRLDMMERLPGLRERLKAALGSLRTGLASLGEGLVTLRSRVAPFTSRVAVQLSATRERLHRPAPAPDAPGPMRPQRILALNWRDPRHPDAGGAELNLFEQATRWARDGHTVTVISARRAGDVELPERETIDGVEVLRMGGRFSVYVHAAWYVLSRSHRHDRILDVANGIPFFAPLFTDRPTALLVHHVHDRQWFAEFPRAVAAVGWFLERWIVPLVYRSKPTIAVSPTTRDALLSTGFRKDQVRIVYNGVTAQAVEDAERGRGTIVYVGRIKRYKRLDRLVRAFAELRPRFPQAQLVIAGDGDARPELLQLAAELDLRDSARFLGFVDEETKARLLAAARVFATPSMHEGWGLSVIEANHHGTPAVAYEVPGLKAAIRQGETGLLARDDRSFREAIASILDDDALHERLSAGAREWATRFDWDASAQQTLEVLHPPAATASTEPTRRRRAGVRGRSERDRDASRAM